MIVALLFYNNEQRFAAMTTAERNRLVERHVSYNFDVLQERALMMVNRALQPTATARTVWPASDPDTSLDDRVADGPFASTGLALSGFYLIDCADLDEAVDLAAAYPMPPGLGCVEVRPVMQQWDYAPSIILDAVQCADVWQVCTNLPDWPEWMPLVEEIDFPAVLQAGAGGKIIFSGQPAATVTVSDVVPPQRLQLMINFERADAALTLEMLISELPRTAAEVTLRATVPRDLLDTVGTGFSERLNGTLRSALRALPARTRPERPR